MMLDFLKIANSGISLNSIAFRLLTHIYHSDSCPHCLGGYSHEGWAWRWYLPKNLLFRASNNLLEHLTAVISLWVYILAGCLNQQDCVLLMTDSTTAEGWLQKSNFTKLGKSLIQASVRIEATQKYATLFMSLEIRSYSQWFKGVMNKAADALSCNDNRSDNELTNTIKSFCPSQVLSHFEIQQLPQKITSWLTELLLKSPVSKQLCETHTRSKLGHGVAGMITRSQSESETTPSSRTSHENNDTQSLEPLPWLSEKDVFQKEIMNNWLQAQLKVPCSMYLRPSENTSTQTQHLTRRKSLCGLYNENLCRLKTLT